MKDGETVRPNELARPVRPNRLSVPRPAVEPRPRRSSPAPAEPEPPSEALVIEEEPVPRGDVMSYRPVIRGIDEDDEPTPARLAADARLEHVVAGLTFGFLLLVPALAFLTNGAATADRTAFALGMVALALAAVVVVAAGLAALRR